jgi:hypothetical protein
LGVPRRTAIVLEAEDLLDQGIDTLRWCRAHFHERKASESLREIQLMLTAVSLALDYEMNGEPEKAALALERAGSTYEAGGLSDPVWEPALFDEGH